MSSTKELISDEMQCWEDCYAERLTLGSFVKATDYGNNIENLEEDKIFMVTSLKFCDNKGVMIGINDGSRESTQTNKDYFNISDLQPV